jgi:Cft2 family RNA processing exonuclease
VAQSGHNHVTENRSSQLTSYPRFFVALGGGDEIGASSYLLVINDKHMLIDAGVRFRGKRVLPNFSYVSQVGMLGLWQLDCVCVTHAHMDHSGGIPSVYQQATDVPIYMTPPTQDIARILWRDMIKISKNDGEFFGDISLENYTKEVTHNTLENIETRGFGKPFEAAQGIEMTFLPAGHILGAAMVLIRIDDYHVLFTGDFCAADQATIPGYRLPEDLPPIDLMVCESTYAYKGFEVPQSLAEQQQSLARQVAEGIRHGGTVLIPAFAVGRSQEVLTILGDDLRDSNGNGYHVWSDGMVNAVCEVYNKHRSYLQPALQKRKPHAIYDRSIGVAHVPTSGPNAWLTNRINSEPPCCVVASSGMLADHSRSAAYAAKLVSGSSNLILFTGYLDEESPGRGLVNAMKRKKRFRINGKSYKRRAEVSQYHLSAHASLPDIVKLVRDVAPKQVLFVHGYPNDPTAESCLHEAFFDLAAAGIQPAIIHNVHPVILS